MLDCHALTCPNYIAPMKTTAEPTPNRMEDIMHPSVDAILKFFTFEHLPPHLQEISKQCADVAHQMAGDLDGPELTAGLRKLLEAKDCFVRAKLAKG